MPLYFAYGSNLWKRGMLRRCPQARLQGYRLVFRGYADLAPETGAAVIGALYRVTPTCLRALDDYEEAPRLYTRHEVTVETADGPQIAITYMMTAAADSQGKTAPAGLKEMTARADSRGMTARAVGGPAPAYYGEIARGYNDWKLDPAVLRRARAAQQPPAAPRATSGGRGRT